MTQGCTDLGEENNNEKRRFRTSWQLKHRCGVITSGAVTIDIFLPDVAENLVSDNQCAGEVWQGTVGGAQGQGGEIW